MLRPKIYGWQDSNLRFTNRLCFVIEFIAARLRFTSKFVRAGRKKKRLTSTRSQYLEYIYKKKCRENYTPSEFLTLDEQFFGFEDKFEAKVYMKNKPDSCAIKIISLNDAKTFYMYNAIPYPGKKSANTFNK